jgi:thiamine-phosphate diphosphorylase
VKNDFLIYLITSGEATAQNFAEKRTEILQLVKIAVETKVSFIQIREKKLSALNLFKLSAAAARIAENSETKILVNDRADIALAANADGVHLAETSLSVETIRRNFPENFIIGASVHSLEKAFEAKQRGADFATFSPIFTTPNKAAPQGLDALRDVCEKLKPFPIIALGGVDETNYQTVLENGARGFASIRFLNDAENLKKLRT